MKIIETPFFSKIMPAFLNDDEYRQLQNLLVINPKLGNVIPHSAGLRKVRWFSSGRGKRGGLRLIYYWYSNDETIFMLLIYKKARQEDLTSQQVKVLKRTMEEYLL